MNTRGSERSSISALNGNTGPDELVAELHDENQLGLYNDSETNNVEEKNSKTKDESKEHPREEMTIIAINTKTEDGGSQSTATEGDGQDAFSRYSNRNVRMMHLLGLDSIAETNEDNIERSMVEEAANAQVNARKTRLSTELHGSAFFLN